VFAIELQAVSPHGQHRRAYEIHVGPDLFGQLVVTIDFGVIGTRGQRRVHLVADIAEARVVVRQALRRRLTAPRRIGVPYRVIACHDPECWLAMMGFLLIDNHLAITVPTLAEPINSPLLQAGYQ
jgi:WGR domain